MRIADYEILSLINESEEFKIYKVRKGNSINEFILKVTAKDFPANSEIKKIENEFKFGTKIKNKNIINYIEIFDYNKGAALVREFFLSDTLSTLIKSSDQNKLDLNHIKKFLEISIQIAETLETLHKNGIIYKNWSPENILYNKDNGNLKIIDFKKAAYMVNENIMTKNYDFSNNFLSYISPELTGRINRIPDGRSDLYSMGVILYEMFLGKIPFENSDPIELIYSHIAESINDPASENSSLPLIISKIIVKLLSKNPEERYQTATGIKLDLQKCLNQVNEIKTLEFKLAEEDFSDKFIIPEKLYGRTKEIELLLTSFDNISSKKSEIFLISGEPGIGKSSLVREISRQIVEKNSYFISGKFEQFQSDVPYSAIVYAVVDFVNQILLETSNRLEYWKEKILTAVGSNGKVLTDVIPSLELVIGKQPEVPILGASETSNRLNLVFENFIECIATKENPLVMFIDDWQWADSASLNFIKNLSRNKEDQALLTIGAYRDNDLELIKPVLLLVDEFIEKNIVKSVVHLDDINEIDIINLLEDTLKFSSDKTLEIEELAEFIKKKTGGNPFFVKQFLKELYNNQNIYFDYDMRYWKWDTEKIKNLTITDNVVELLIKKIEQLNPKTINTLKYGACLGKYFNSNILKKLLKQALDDIAADIQPAITQGLIYIFEKEEENKNIEIEFKFIHDRIEQAVYSLINNENRQEMHLQIGHILLIDQDNKRENIFEIVKHLNIGKKLIVDSEELLNLAQLNLEAGLAAKKSAAYESAYKYFNLALQLLNQNRWLEHYKLTLDVYTNLVEICSLTGKYELMDEYSEIVLNTANSIIDKIPIYKIKIQAYQVQLKLQEALILCKEGLKLTGIDIPDEPKKEDINKNIIAIKKLIGKKKIEDLAKLPQMEDPKNVAAVELLAGSMSVTYKAAPMLTPIVVCKMMELLLNYGNSSLSAVVYMSYSLMLCSITNDIDFKDEWEENIDLGYKLGRIGLDIVEKEDLKQHKTLTLEFDNFAIKHWKEHLSSTLEANTQGYWSGMENGNFEYAGYCLASYTFSDFFIGTPLNEVTDVIRKNIEKLRKIEHELTENWVSIFGQMAENLQGESENKFLLEGSFCSESETLPVISSIGDMIAMFLLYFSKMHLNYFFEDYSSAHKFAEKAEENLPGMAGTPHIAVFYFMESLVNLAIYDSVSSEEQKKLLSKVNNNQFKLKEWAKQGPTNLLHKYYLVEAEYKKINKEYDKAENYYIKAIELAKENKYLSEEGLAHELAAKFYLGFDNIEKTKSHIREAYFIYQRWNASAKAEQIKSSYIQFFSDIKDSNNEKPDFIDMTALLRSTQAISKEMNVESIINKLIDILTKITGAQKVIFIRKDLNDLYIEAFLDRENNINDILKSTPIEECKCFPKAAVLYTARTGETIFYPQKGEETLFNKDTYIAKNKPKSFLSTSVMLNNEIKGTIYLENNLIENAFSESIIEVVEILASQAAISLENAVMYNTMEEKVMERTKELEKINEELEIEKEKAESANKAKSEFLTNVSHEIRTPMNTILGFTDIIRNKLEDPKLLYYTDAVYSSGKILLNLINDILDLSKIEAGKLYIKPEATSIKQIFDEIELIFENKIRERGINFIKTISSDIPSTLLIDETRLRQVLINLVGNAVKFTSSGYIEISADYIQNETSKTIDLLISVKDTGIGISDDEKESIFLPFTQLNKIITSSLNGTGLGLTITKKLLEGMNGAIKVSSEVGKGSRFDVNIRNVEVLEKNKQKSVIEKQINLNSIKFKKSTVIIADDIKYNREIFIEFLKKYDFNILEAENGKEILDIINQEEKIDLIMLDIKMPVMDGYEVISILKSDEDTQNIPIMGVTASLLKHDETKLKNLSDSYLIKPVKKEELILKIMEYLPHEIIHETPISGIVDKDILNKNYLLQYPALLNSINNDKEYIQELLEDMAIDKIEHYAQKLSSKGKAGNATIVEKFGKNLYDAAISFKIDEIKLMLKQLLEI